MKQYTFRPIQQWPRPFTKHRRRSQFDSTYSATLDKLDGELTKLGARNIVIQVALKERDIRNDGLPRADARQPEHPGVIVSFDSRHGALSYMCDEFFNWKDNLRGIALTLERLRLVDLYGVTKSGEQYKGWAALPQGSENQSVRDAAHFICAFVPDTASGDEIIANRDLFGLAHRAAMRKAHPDSGGTTESFQKLQQAAEVLKKHHGL